MKTLAKTKQEILFNAIDAMTNKSLREEKYHEIERILNDFKNGATYSDSIEKVQALFAEKDEALLEQINSKGILIQGMVEMNGKLYLQVNADAVTANTVILLDSSVLSLLAKE